jgi:rSAM/selenodomain-associated transferase 2
MKLSVVISVVVPVLNEAAGIVATLASLAPLRAAGHEVIVADGGSSDGTVALAAAQADEVVAAPRGRARQMNAGAAQARGEVLLFLHADTRLPHDAAAQLQRALAAGAHWGRFDLRIEADAAARRAGRWMFPLVSALINLRSRLSGIATGDQAIFVRTSLFQQLGGYADQPLMEDIELCRRLKALPAAGAPACLRTRVATSGRRWQQHGVWRTIFLMWRLRWRYWRGESPDRLAQDYR